MKPDRQFLPDGQFFADGQMLTNESSTTPALCPTVLVVDSESHVQRLVSLLCEKCGYTTQSAITGEDALKWLRNGAQPRLILLDIILPGVDGLQILRSLKLEPRLKEIPVILLTSLAQENIVIQGVRLGAVGFIRKPFHPDAVLGRLAQALATTRQSEGMTE